MKQAVHWLAFFLILNGLAVVTLLGMHFPWQSLLSLGLEEMPPDTPSAQVFIFSE